MEDMDLGTTEYVKLGEQQDGLDQFELDEQEVETLYGETMYENNVDFDAYYDGMKEFTDYLENLVGDVNDLADDAMDTGATDFSGEVDIDSDKDERRALKVFKNEIVAKLNQQIEAQLLEAEELQSGTIDTIKDYDLLDGSTLEALEQTIKSRITKIKASDSNSNVFSAFNAYDLLKERSLASKD